MPIETVVLFVLGVVLLIIGANTLVRGASAIALGLGISPLVVGLTVVAFGTSAPELAVSVQSALSGPRGGDIALGNVVGSNIANILLILGLSALLAPLMIKSQLIRVDVPIMIGASLLVILLGFDGRIAPVEGLVLFIGILAYTGFSIAQSRREQRQLQAAEAGVPIIRTWFDWLRDIVLVVGGLTMLVFGADWIVNGAVMAARVLGVNELLIGLTIVAVGTSLPEIATSIAAAVRGERDLAVGNAVGSNIFNLLCVLGLTALVAPGGVGVPPEALAFDLPFMLAVAVACLPIFLRGRLIARWEGVLFLAYYAAYLVLLVLQAGNDPATPLFRGIVFVLVGSLIILTVSFLAAREAWRIRRVNVGS